MVSSYDTRGLKSEFTVEIFSNSKFTKLDLPNLRKAQPKASVRVYSPNWNSYRKQHQYVDSTQNDLRD